MDNEKRYDWYEEDFASFLLSLNLPAYRKDMPTKVALSSEKETFVSGFDEMIGKRKFRIIEVETLWGHLFIVDQDLRFPGDVLS